MIEQHPRDTAKLVYQGPVPQNVVEVEARRAETAKARQSKQVRNMLKISLRRGPMSVTELQHWIQFNVVTGAWRLFAPPPAADRELGETARSEIERRFWASKLTRTRLDRMKLHAHVASWHFRNMSRERRDFCFRLEEQIYASSIPSLRCQTTRVSRGALQCKFPRSTRSHLS